MSLQELQLSETDVENWHRLSRWSIFHYVARTLLSAVNNLYALIPIIYGASQLELFWLFWLLLLIVVLVAGTAYLTYSHFSYQILEDAIQVRRGIIFKKQLNLTFRRIQNINIEHPFYFRPIGLVTLKIDGAGSSGEEVYLSALLIDEAEKIRARIQNQHGRSDEQPVEDAGEGEEKFYSRSTADLVVHGLTNNRAWIILGGFFAIYSQVAEQVNTYFRSIGVDLSALVEGQTVVALISLIFFSLVFAVAIMAVLSVLGSIVTYHQFALYRSDKSLTVRRGLFNRHEIHARKSRVQTVFLRQDWLDNLLGRLNLVYEQISHLRSGKDQKKLVVPAVFTAETAALVKEVFSLKDVFALEFEPSSKRLFYKNAIVWSLIYGLIFIALWSNLQGPVYQAFIPGLPWSLHIALLYMAWKRKGLAIHDDIIVVRSGIIGIDYVIFRCNKIQEIKFIQSPLMKRRRLATVQFCTASRTVTMPHIDQDIARWVIDYGLYCVESTNESWM